MTDWINSSIFYHIYPLGLCNAPHENLGEATAAERLVVLYEWLDNIQELGCNALYLGPVFQSKTHGYDTSDYYQVDSRLGSNETLKAFSAELHRRGIRLILDGVFNHVGRDFWAFRDLLQHGQASPYVDWFVGVDFSRSSSMGDAFEYATWEGHSSLPKLNLRHPAVRKHLFDAVLWWMEEFSIDGLRLDAADCVEPAFWKELHHITKSVNPDFWLMGEIIHGDYRQWANAEMFDSVTNYTAYKGLWSSLNDANYHEIAYTLRQQSDHQQGQLRHLSLYNFVDNHDVSRVASLLKDRSLLYPLYLLLFMMPGIPSIYYGSEFGIHGRKEDGDAALRTAEDISLLLRENLSLQQAIQQFSAIRKESKAVQQGDFRTLDVQMEQLAFQRSYADEVVIVVINAAQEQVLVEVPIKGIHSNSATDMLNDGQHIDLKNGHYSGMVPARWGRVLRIKTRA